MRHPQMSTSLRQGLVRTPKNAQCSKACLSGFTFQPHKGTPPLFVVFLEVTAFPGNITCRCLTTVPSQHENFTRVRPDSHALFCTVLHPATVTRLPCRSPLCSFLA